MEGETDLSRLLAGMEPVLHEGEFVFCSVDPVQRKNLSVPAVCEFAEEEGVTLIVRRSDAEASGLPFQYPCRMVTLRVHSSLEAVGFLASVCGKLAGLGISVNPVSAYFHDHLFVPSDRAEEVVSALRSLARGA